MNRRGFLASILTASVAPAIVRAESLMQVVYRPIVVTAATATVMRPALEIGHIVYRDADGFWRPVRKETILPAELGVWNGREVLCQWHYQQTTLGYLTK